MNKAQLQKRYPEHSVRHNPAAQCPVCRGEGHYKTRAGMMVCLCACVDGTPADRAKAADALRAGVRMCRARFEANPEAYVADIVKGLRDFMKQRAKP